MHAIPIILGVTRFDVPEHLLIELAAYVHTLEDATVASLQPCFNAIHRNLSQHLVKALGIFNMVYTTKLRQKPTAACQLVG